MLNIAEGFAEASGIKSKEKKEMQLSGNKAAVILNARSLLSPALCIFLGFELKKGELSFGFSLPHYHRFLNSASKPMTIAMTTATKMPYSNAVLSGGIWVGVGVAVAVGASLTLT